MSEKIKKVVVTGGAGNIAYSLLFRIANGDLLGTHQPISLHIVDVPEAVENLEGIRMELEDCAFPLLREILIGSDPNILFRGVEYALLVGAKPRGPGMERKDLLLENAKIFVEQGAALNAVAHPDCKVLVVGNPCNTNALICMSNAPRLPRKNFMAMTRLDQNRAKSLLARKGNADLNEVTRVTIWGNHSATQVPDFLNARIRDHAVFESIPDRNWLEKEFFQTVQQRGAAIIKARGKSSASSAANAAIDTIQSLLHPTPKGDWFSVAIPSDGNPYGVTPGLIFSLPCRSTGNGNCEIVSGLEIDPFLQEKIRATEKELLEEKAMVETLLIAR